MLLGRTSLSPPLHRRILGPPGEGVKVGKDLLILPGPCQPAHEALWIWIRGRGACQNNRASVGYVGRYLNLSFATTRRTKLLFFAGMTETIFYSDDFPYKVGIEMN